MAQNFASALAHCSHQPAHTENAKRQCLGMLGEAAVADFCIEHGMQVLARNWRCKLGELDLIIKAGAQIAAVEVKTRNGNGYGSPFAAVTPQKIKKLKLLLCAWLRDNRIVIDAPPRIDVAAVTVTQQHVVEIDYLAGVE